MNIIAIKIIGTFATILICLGGGCLIGIAASYILFLIRGYIFNYTPMLYFGTVFGVYGMYSAIRTFWLYK